MRIAESFVSLLTLAMICAISVQGQTKSLLISVDGPRPLAAACDRIEALSGMAVRYEEGRYLNPADLKDVTGEALTPEQQKRAGPEFHLIGPRGGRISATVLLEDGTPNITSSVGARAAAVAFVEAQKATHDQTFVVESDDGGLFIRPQEFRDQAGIARAITPVLSARISIPLGTRSAYETLTLITEAVSKVTGERVEKGTVPIRTFATSNVSIGCNSETARGVLNTLFKAIVSQDGMNVSIGAPGLSYRLFSDAMDGSYALNVHWLPGAQVPNGSSPSDPAPLPKNQEGNPFFRTAHP